MPYIDQKYTHTEAFYSCGVFVQALGARYHLGMDRLPRWNMTSIYPSPDSGEFISESARLKEAGEAIIAAASDPSSSVRTLIDLKDKGDSILVTMTAYADALLSTDSSDPAFLKAVSIAEEAAVGYQKAEDAFIRAISLHPEAAEDPSLADYRRYILLDHLHGNA